jgi:hypothetical protein
LEYSLELVSKNLSAIDSNAEENFKTIVHSLDLVSQNNKKSTTSLSIQFDNMIRNPLSINPEMTKIIAENTAKSERACSTLTKSVDKLNTDLTSTADYIVTSLRQDAILENSANNSELNTVKDLLIQQNIRTEGLKTEFSEQIKIMQSNLSQEIKNSIESIANNVASQLKQSGYVGTTAQNHFNSPPRFNNPYMDEKMLRNDRDSAPHISNSHPIAVQQQPSRNSQPQLNESENNCAQPQQHHNYNRTQSRYNTMDYATLNKLLPPVTDWPKFDGADDYDHISFIKYIDHILLSYNADDELVLCRLPRLFEGVALQWFITKQESLGKQSWNLAPECGKKK